LQLKTFRNPITSTEIIDIDILSLKKYLTYCLSLSVYEEARIATLEELKLIKKIHVENVLRKLDQEERENWGWSPLFLIFK
jgi:hypothetical protein